MKVATLESVTKLVEEIKNRFATKTDVGIVPLMSALYTGLYYGANSTSNGYFEPICVKPKDPDKVLGTYYLRFRMSTLCAAYPSYMNFSEVEVWFTRTGSINCSRVWNWRVGSYLHYYVGVSYPSTNANFNTIGTHLGVGITSGNNYNSANYKRDTLIEILEVSDDLVVTLDAPEDTKQYTKMPWYDANLIAHSTLNAVDVGMQETGDSNTYDRTYMNAARFVVGDKYRVHGYSIVMFTPDDKVVPISVCGTSYTTTAYTIANGTRVFNTDVGIDYTKGIFYLSTGTNFAVNGITSSSVAYVSLPGIDLRYSDNTLASNTAANTLGIIEPKRVYIRGVIKEDGLFYIRPAKVTYNKNEYYRALVQELPSESEYDDDGYKVVYWLFGFSYYNSSYTTRGYQATLAYDNPMFEINDEGRLAPYINSLIPTQVSQLSNDSNFIPDAPSDDLPYVRKNGAWTVQQPQERIVLISPDTYYDYF